MSFKYMSLSTMTNPNIYELNKVREPQYNTLKTNAFLREADYVSEVVKKHGLTLVRKKGEGSLIEGTESDKQKLLNAVSQKKELVVTDKEKRRNLLKLELLRNREPQKLFYFSNLFGVSEATISTDLDALEKWAKECHINIVKKPGFGIMLSASERNYRVAIQRFVIQSLQDMSVQVLLFR